MRHLAAAWLVMAMMACASAPRGPTDDGHLILKLSRAWPDGRVMTGWVKWKRAGT